MKIRFSILVPLIVVPLLHAEPVVTNTVMFQPDRSTYVFYRGEVNLSADGIWDATIATSGTDVVQLYVIPPAKNVEIQMGRRMLAVENERQVRRGQYAVSQLYWPCREYAKQHENIGPNSITNLDAKKYPYLLDSLKHSPYETSTNGPEGPFVFLVPDAKFEAAPDNEIPDSENKQALAVELRPYINDGKHWVAFTDGSFTREIVDKELLKKYGLTIRPVISQQSGPTNPVLQNELSYRIVAVRKQGASSPIPLDFRSSPSGARLNIAWNPADAKTDEKAVRNDLKAGRVASWTPYALSARSRVWKTWLEACNGPGIREDTPRNQMTSLFGLFGGRAAMQETLQLQNMDATRDDKSQQTVPIETIKGVEIKSHPYEEMLKGEKGGELALANFVPRDRFFIYIARPETILPFLDTGADFLSVLGTTLTGNSVDYDLKAKYLARLGLTYEWLKLFLTPEIVKEMALVFPDLFFIDGTDVTVVSRLAEPKLIAEALKQAGIADLKDDNVMVRDLGEGRNAYWALRKDLLVAGTSKSELEAVLALQGDAGKDSLGQSAEFRYMLTQLPVRSVTRMYAYFSDPFIRRQVGPAVKIGQLRRAAALAKMEQITAAALLAQMDGMSVSNSVSALCDRRYLPPAESFQPGDYALDTNLTVSSKTYGTPKNLTPLLSLPVDRATQKEADAYKAYVGNYNRYWRQYFDPIAIRLDDSPGNALEATTFILPLIDNTAYNGVRAALLTREDGMELKAPGIAPEPVTMLSLNLRDELWLKIVESLSEIFTRYGGVSPAALDDLGPGLHLAIHDADPVIALGSGDMLGVFNANLFSGGRGGQMMFIPIALSVLTRPCSLIVETRNPERTRQYLRQTTGLRPRTQERLDGVDVTFSQVEGQDSWICTLDIMGLMRLRYGLEVQGGYVVIRNIPWSNKDRVARTDTAPLNGACLQAYPAACNLQMAGLFAATQDRFLASAMQGIGALYPLVASGYATAETAATEHARLFGFKPVHPGSGKWMWDGRDLTSSQYGSVLRQRQPTYKEKDVFGLLNDIEHLCVSLQFEDTGLRTLVRWKPK
jgi:hypothetical protein